MYSTRDSRAQRTAVVYFFIFTSLIVLDFEPRLQPIAYYYRVQLLIPCRPIKCMFNWSSPSTEYYQFFGNNFPAYQEPYGGGYLGDVGVPQPTEAHQLLAEERGMHHMRSPAAEGFNMLFQPTHNLTDLFDDIFAVNNMTIDTNYIAIHLRTGLDFSNDINRMGTSGISPSYECVLQYERKLGLPADTPWFIAADYSQAHQVRASC